MLFRYVRYRINIYFLSLLIVFLFLFSSCKKFVVAPVPTTEVSSAIAYSSDASSTAVLTSIYNGMIAGTGFASGDGSIGFITALISDEIKNYSTNLALSLAYKNNQRAGGSNYWPELYKNIYITNAAIEGITNSKTLTPDVKNHLLGEARFMRAFFYFYLVNLYGDVPLLTSTDYKKNSVTPRTSKAEVYQHIIDDLKLASELLRSDYIAPSHEATTDRVRPNKAAASGLLARVYLYTGDWVNAEIASTEVINNTAQFMLEADLDKVFLKNSSEAIFQLQPVLPGYNVFDAMYYILTGAPGSATLERVAMSSFLSAAFEANDKRFNKWVGSVTVSGTTYYFPYKYRIVEAFQPVTEYFMVLRLAEQYLIRAEARVQQNNFDGAQDDIDVIRLRAGLAGTTANNKEDLLNAILQERRVEFFTEWGHRWLDLKRTGKVNEVMSVIAPLKGGSWDTNWQLFALPNGDLDLNPYLTQNPGHN